MIIAGTGHRPEDCVHNEGIVRLLIAIKLKGSLEDHVVDSVISGMASGYDLWLADEAIKLNIPVIAARPWAGHKPRKDDEDLYKHVIDSAVKVVDVDPAEEYPGAWVYHNRNHWMVDNATHLLAYWSGKEKGGTYECWTYAENKIPRHNLINDPPF